MENMIQNNNNGTSLQVDTMWLYQKNGTPEHASEDVPVDYAVFWEFMDMVGGSDPDVANEFISLFIDDARVYLVNMRQALDQGDSKTLNQAAHTLKSNSAQFGAMNLAFYCREIESAEGESLKVLESLVHNAETEYTKVKRILNTLRNFNYGAG
jgi:HPt (histidine-containing phosphotransfer) domain-containing protein